MKGQRIWVCGAQDSGVITWFPIISESKISCIFHLFLLCNFMEFLPSLAIIISPSKALILPYLYVTICGHHSCGIGKGPFVSIVSMPFYTFCGIVSRFTTHCSLEVKFNMLQFLSWCGNTTQFLVYTSDLIFILFLQEKTFSLYKDYSHKIINADVLYNEISFINHSIKLIKALISEQEHQLQ